MVRRKNGNIKQSRSKSGSERVDIPKTDIAGDEDGPILPSRPFPIVGVGASAGGLEAFSAFFGSLPDKTGVGFVVVAHLDPTHVTLLPDLLQRTTDMSVVSAEDQMTVHPDTIYVIPPNADIYLAEGQLRLTARAVVRGIGHPIDTFLVSLAEDRGVDAIGIVLSGTGSDGTEGVRAIKRGQGTVMVQSEETAKYKGMPACAIATGVADYVASPEELASRLMQYVQDRPAAQLPTSTLTVSPAMTLQRILNLLCKETGQDFSLYKKNTISRRIEHRMHVQQVKDIQEYERFLKNNKNEAHALFKELLIGVTSFFREPEAFAFLLDEILPSLFKDKPDDDPVRVWVPGCSTGEEAYSIAIVFQDYMVQMQRSLDVQIFATDIDEKAINKARRGLYPESIQGDISPERLRRYFTHLENGYQIKKAVRESLVFANQNLIQDPPFTKLDLVSCRNLLIYLEGKLQQKLLPIFHYCLKPNGVLFLGSSETIGHKSDLFFVVDKRWKIFKRRTDTTSASGALRMPAAVVNSKTMDSLEMVHRPSVTKEHHTLRLLEAILAQSSTPPCVIIDEFFNIVYVHGRIGRYLEHAVGNATLNVLDMARPGLRVELAVAIRNAATRKTEIVHNALQIQLEDDFIELNVRVCPLPDQTHFHGFMMVVFEEFPSKADDDALSLPPDDKSKRRFAVKQLEIELQHTKESLQTTIEELETSNEELKSTNEELQSANEELQSTNEELETSKEELQSLNEETSAVNTELQCHIEELSKAHDDMKNLLDSTEIATIFLDVDFRIRRFTNKAVELVPLTGGDIGRPISHFAANLPGVDLVRYADLVMADLHAREIEVSGSNNKAYFMRVRPYRTTNNVIEGVVFTFERVIENQGLMERLLIAEQESADAQLQAKIGNWMWDLQNDTVKWSDQMYRIVGLPKGLFTPTPETYTGMVHPDDLWVSAQEQMGLNSCNDDYEIEYRIIDQQTKEIKYVHAWGKNTFDDEGKLVRITGTLQDVSSQKNMALRLAENEERFRFLTENSMDQIILLDGQLNIRYINRTLLNLTPAEAVGKNVLECIVTDRGQASTAKMCFFEVLADGKSRRFQVSNSDEKGVLRRYDVRVAPVTHGEEIIGLSVSKTDITELVVDRR